VSFTPSPLGEKNGSVNDSAESLHIDLRWARLLSTNCSLMVRASSTLAVRVYWPATDGVIQGTTLSQSGPHSRADD